MRSHALAKSCMNSNTTERTDIDSFIKAYLMSKASGTLEQAAADEE